MKDQIVFALVKGERYEGYHILDIFSDKPKAIDAASHYMTEMFGHLWEWNEKLSMWEDGCDYIRIIAYNIQ